MNECKSTACGRPAKTRGYCHSHYARLWRGVDPNKPLEQWNHGKTVQERFWMKVFPEPNTGCWLWTGSLTNGYGSISVNGRLRRAHRVSYEMHKGKIPKDLQIDHLCRVRSCVNPEHLEPVTEAENIRRGESGINNRIKTHCPQGHPYSGTNLYVNPKGSRICVECRNEKRRAKRRASKL